MNTNAHSRLTVWWKYPTTSSHWQLSGAGLFKFPPLPPPLPVFLLPKLPQPAQSAEPAQQGGLGAHRQPLSLNSPTFYPSTLAPSYPSKLPLIPNFNPQATSLPTPHSLPWWGPSLHQVVGVRVSILVPSLSLNSHKLNVPWVFYFRPYITYQRVPIPYSVLWYYLS